MWRVENELDNAVLDICLIELILFMIVAIFPLAKSDLRYGEVFKRCAPILPLQLLLLLLFGVAVVVAVHQNHVFAIPLFTLLTNSFPLAEQFVSANSCCATKTKSLPRKKIEEKKRFLSKLRKNDLYAWHDTFMDV
jgi:hypothetical protein